MKVGRAMFSRRPWAAIAVLLVALGVFHPLAAAQSYVFGTASYLAPGLSTGPTMGNTSMIAADFNGDGIPDFAMVGEDSSGNALSIFLGRSDGTFAPMEQYLIAAYGLTAGDFNGDGKLDIVVVGDNYASPANILFGNGDGTFQAPVPLNQENGIGSTVGSADFNGDGKLDLVSVTGAAVTILLGNGDGTFQAPASYTVAGGPFLALGDFNGDGKPDVAVAGYDSQEPLVFVLLNNGQGGLKSAVPYDIPSAALALGAADVNGDGKLDLIAPTGGSSAGVSVLPGNGDGTFGSAITTASSLLSPYGTSLAIADYNGDGKLDLALTDSSGPANAVAVMFGNDDGTFQSPLLYSAGLYPNGVLAFDINGDGKPDLAVAGGYGVLYYYSVLVLLNQGRGTFANRSTYPVLKYPYSAVEGDFNGDGKADIATTIDASPGYVSTLLGKGDGTFQPHQDSSTGPNPAAMASGDFNGDGKLDLVVADSTPQFKPLLSTLLGNGDGTFQNNINQNVSGSLVSLAVGDFNNDGKLDVAATIYDTSTVLVFLGKGDGTFAAPVQYQVGPMDDSPPYHNVLTGDFNGDGNLDLVVTTDAGVSILLGNGNGTFQPYTAILPGQALLAVADFNGDGTADLLLENGPGVPSVALGNGDGTFEQATGYQLPSIVYIEAATVGDFNGDGKLDVAFADQGSDLVTVLLGNGDGTFGWHIEYESGAVSNTVNLIVAADFNRDGTPDVALANFGDGTVSVLLSSPVAALSPSTLNFAGQIVNTRSAESAVVLTNPGSAPLTISQIATTGDFAQTNSCSQITIGGSCTVNVTFNPTTTGEQNGTLTITDNAPGSPHSVALGGEGITLAQDPTLVVDFYGDGEGEPAVFRPSDGTWYVHSNSKSGGNLTQVWGQAGDVPEPADYDGDGKSDFALWRPSTGTWYIIPSSNPKSPIITAWGSPDDVPVPADYDGDGVSDIAVWRPSTGTWYIIPSNGGPNISKQWGQTGDIPVIGDYDGDGKADYAVFRPSNGTWYVLFSSTGKSASTAWGEPGDIPVEGDYDGDGKTDYAVWQPSTGTWSVMLSSTGHTTTQVWGTIGDIPVVGDYNGDGKNDYAVFRPSNATWYFNYTSGGTSNQQYGETGDIPATHLPSMYRRDKHIANFDGDRKADIGVFGPSNGTWYVIDSSTGKSTSQVFGENGDIIVPGDYDGDGKTDYAVWRPSNQTCYVTLSSTGKTTTQVWGASGDIPVPGDYDGDGKTDYAVFRPSTATWYVIFSSTGTSTHQQWGESTDIPVPADYDGDGKTDYAVFRPSTATWYVIFSSTGTSTHQQWGANGDIPVPGDYDGDTKADYTVFRPSTGTWYTLQSSTGKTVSTLYGENGDIPVAKDYDGDEKTDIAVFRPSNGTWYILQSSNGQATKTQWGTSTDVPVNKPTGQ